MKQNLEFYWLRHVFEQESQEEDNDNKYGENDHDIYIKVS